MSIHNHTPPQTQIPCIRQLPYFAVLRRCWKVRVLLHCGVKPRRIGAAETVGCLGVIPPRRLHCALGRLCEHELSRRPSGLTAMTGKMQATRVIS